MDKYHLARNTARHANADISLMQCYPLPKAPILTQREHSGTQNCPRMLIFDGYLLRKANPNCWWISIDFCESMIRILCLVFAQISILEGRNAYCLLPLYFGEMLAGTEFRRQLDFMFLGTDLLGKASSAIPLLKSGQQLPVLTALLCAFRRF